MQSKVQLMFFVMLMSFASTFFFPQPLVFGAMIHRDEAFEAIFTQYMKIMTTAKPPASTEL